MSLSRRVLLERFHCSYIPKTSLPEFPQPLLMLYDPNFFKKCESIELTITPKMILSIENEPKQQYYYNVWFNYRSGRITASHMKSLCHTSAANPDSGSGATPDGTTSCTCCGVGIVEIKCPYCHRERDAAEDKKFCLQKGLDGKLHLHAIYYLSSSDIVVHCQNVLKSRERHTH